MLRYLPENLLIPGGTQSLELELSQPIFSWKVGLRPIRTRIEGLTTLGDAIGDELRRNLRSQEADWKYQASQAQILASDVAKLSVCLSNARMLVQSSQRHSCTKAFRLLQLDRRRGRITETVGLLDRITQMGDVLNSVTKKSVVDDFGRFKAVLEDLPRDLHIIESIQARLTLVINDYRAELARSLAMVTSIRGSLVFEDELASQLTSEFGSSADSFLTSDAVFWFRCSSKDEDALVSEFIGTFFRDKLLAKILNGETWERLLKNSSECDCHTSALLGVVVKRIGGLHTQVPVLDEELLARMQSELVKIYCALLLVTFGGAAFCALVSRGVEADLHNAHECWLTRQRLPRLLTVLESAHVSRYMDEINRLRPRTGRASTITQQVVAVESFRALGDSATFCELADAVWLPLLSSAFAHAFERWHMLLETTENYTEANKYLVSEMRAFFSMLRCTGGGTLPGSAIEHMSILASRPIVIAILELIPALLAEVEDDEDVRARFLAEAVSDLQRRLDKAAVVTIDKTEWSLVFECLHLISNAELLLSWAVSNLLRVPLRVLEPLMEVAEPDEDVRGDLMDILRTQAVAFINSS